MLRPTARRRSHPTIDNRSVSEPQTRNTIGSHISGMAGQGNQRVPDWLRMPETPVTLNAREYTMQVARAQ
jgi:hypothetical protein